MELQWMKYRVGGKKKEHCILLELWKEVEEFILWDFQLSLWKKRWLEEMVILEKREEWARFEISSEDMWENVNLKEKQKDHWGNIEIPLWL